MGYYMRFVSTDARPVVPAELRDALAAVSPTYNVEIDDLAATISYDGDVIAHVEINVPGDGLFDQERAELVEFANAVAGDEAAKTRVVNTLQTATGIVAAQVLFGTGHTETTLARLDPLWVWLFGNRTGLLQADDEGYYDPSHVVLHVD